MNKNLHSLLIDMKFSQPEIETLVSTCPMLDEVDFELVEANLSAVTNFGYPADDLTFLVAVNPNFLCRTTGDLVTDLEYISEFFPDVETALKNDPNLI